MKLPTLIDTTAWASQQDKVFAGQATKESVNEFHALFEVQGAIAMSNLVIRQLVIYGDMVAARSGYLSLEKNWYWVEGPEYLDYTQKAYEWKDGRSIFLKQVKESYSHIAAPTGEIPLPEVRENYRVTPKADGDISNDSYYVRYWKNAYLIIGFETEFQTRNLHHRPMGFAFWKDGKWLARPTPYTGFNLADTLKDEADRGNTVPRGSFPADWRLNPPKITTSILPNRVTIRYDLPRRLFGLIPGKSITRTYTIGDELIVADQGKVIFRG